MPGYRTRQVKLNIYIHTFVPKANPVLMIFLPCSAVVEEYAGEYYVYFYPFPESIALQCLTAHISLNGAPEPTSLLMQRTTTDGRVAYATPLSYNQQLEMSQSPASFLFYYFTYCTLGVQCDSDDFLFEVYTSSLLWPVVVLHFVCFVDPHADGCAGNAGRK